MTVAVSIALLSGGSAAGAQESALALEVVPDKLALAPGETADVRVILRNAGASLPGGNLSWAPAGMGAVPDPGFPPLGPNQSHSWLVTVTRPADAGPAGQLVFSVAVPTGPSGPTAAVATAAVAVEDRTVIGLDDLVMVSVGPELEDLHRYRGEVDFHLTATSTANVPVEIVGIEVDAPSFVDLKPEGYKPSTAAGRVALIEPGGTVYCRDTAAVTGTVQPGAHRAAFIVNLALPEGGRPRTGSVVVTHELQASVAGESEFLTFLGVPTFLLGVLVLAIYRLAARQWASDSRIGQLDIKLPEYTALSATISIVILVLYHLVTGALRGPARNVLRLRVARRADDMDVLGVHGDTPGRPAESGDAVPASPPDPDPQRLRAGPPPPPRTQRTRTFTPPRGRDPVRNGSRIRRAARERGRHEDLGRAGHRLRIPGQPPG